MILATWQQERALVKGLCDEGSLSITGKSSEENGSENAVGRVYMNISAGEFLYALPHGFASALQQGKNQQTWNMATAFNIQL